MLLSNVPFRPQTSLPPNSTPADDSRHSVTLSLVVTLMALLVFSAPSRAQETKLVPGAEQTGYSVSIEPGWALVGGTGASSSLFRQVGGIWRPRVELSPTTSNSFPRFGQGVALNDVGFDAVVGTSGWTGSVGHFAEVYVFDSSGDTTALIKHSWVPGATSSFGSSVDISGDWLIVGDPDYNGTFGAVMFFERTSGTPAWTYRHTKTHPLADGVSSFGRAIAIHGDFAIAGIEFADTSLVGGKYYGAAAMWYRNQGGTDNWGAIPDIFHDDQADWDEFGRSVDIDDGYAIVGAPYKDPAGAAYIFEKHPTDPTVWTRIAGLTPTGGVGGTNMGMSVSISPPYAAAGATEDDDPVTNAGAAFIFHKDKGGADTWGQTAKIKPSDPTSSKRFGNAISIGGNYALVGAENDASNGSAYLFGQHTLDGWLVGADAEVISGDGTFDFGTETGVDIGMTGMGGTGRVAIDCFSIAPISVSGVSETYVLDEHWWITADSSLSLGATQVRFKISEFKPSGINSAGDVVVYSRPAYGTGAFSALTTTYEAGAGEIVASGVTKFSEFIMASNTSLPVELTSFQAIVDGADVELSWATASEDNNAGFEIQIARNGSTSFEVVGFVEGAGTTSKPRDYAFRVTDIGFGQHTFRLRQIDFDGAFSFSGLVEVSITSVPDAFVLEPVYPNPFNPTASVSFGVKIEQPVSIVLIDALGRSVRELYSGTPKAGALHTVSIDGSDLPSGVYQVVMRGGGNRAVQTVTLLK
ncbi:T9SS type A sorting domain-containing protein [Bacteroidota bacterium]